MEQYKAIPPGYMTVGQIAKSMDVTVRTLQYYDKEGILTPSSESEGGRRLYTHKDIVKLHQIQAMKYLGFSLDDIKARLPSINTPQEVSAALTQQAAGVREKIKSLKRVLEAVEKLNAEVVQMDTVNWETYADIVTLLQLKNDSYWVLKHLSGGTTEHIRERFHNDEGTQLHENYQKLLKRAVETQRNGHSPESEQGQQLARDWWDYTMEFTQGDMGLLSELHKLGDGLSDSEWSDKFSFDKAFLGDALQIYFANIGYDPQGGNK